MVSSRSGPVVAFTAAITFAVSVAVFGSVAAHAAAVAAAPQVSVVGGTAIPTHAPSTDQVTYTISVGDAPAEQVVLHVHQPDGTKAASTVEVDGAPAPADTVGAAGNGLRIRLGTGADAAHGGTLDIGNHVISFDTQVTSLPQGAAAAYGVVDYVDRGLTKQARSPSIPLAVPDIALTKPTGSGENRVLPLGTGVDADFEAILSNSGGSASAASLTIVLPRGMKIDRGFGVFRDDQYRNVVDTGGVKLPCRTVAVHPAEHVVSCALGAVPAGTSALLDVPLQPTPVAPVGRVGTFAISAAADNGLDAAFADNTVHGSVRFTGIAHLVVKIAPGRLRIPVGHTGRLVVSLYNAGPDPALKTLAVLAVRGSNFTILRRRPSAAATSRGRPIVVWRAGTVAARRTARTVVVLKAVSAGRDELLAAAGSASGDPPCEGVNPTPQCQAFAYARLVATRSAQRNATTRSLRAPATRRPAAATYRDRGTSRLR